MPQLSAPLFGGQQGGQNIDPAKLYQYQLIRELAKSGTSTAPVSSPWEGVGRLGQAAAGALGTYMMGQQQKEEQGQDAATMAQALRAFKPGWADPGGTPTPEVAAQPLPPGATPSQPGQTTATGGGMDRMMEVLAGNPRLAPLGLQMGVNQITEAQKAKAAMAQALLGKGLREGANGAVEPIPNYGQALGGIEGQVEGGKQAGVTPALVARDRAMLGNQLDMKPQIERATAAAVAPIEIGKATSIYGANRNTDIATVGALEANRTAGKLSGELSPGPGGVPLIQERERVAAAGQTAGTGAMPKSETALRSEFEGNALVKNYRETVPVYNSIVDAAKRDNKASDLNIVYGLAKIMDPTSVVREGEFKMAAAAGSPAERMIGLFNEIVGGGRLTPQQRAQFIDEAKGRVSSYKAAHDQIASQYGGLARQYGVKPENVITQVGVVDTPAAAGATPSARPRATDGKGNSVEWDGQAWVPVK